jgi:CelD/BcsL family acetyltransferase involved in cellulose biosynthesis
MIGTPDPAMSEQFDALAQSAAPNVFMHPAALCAAAATGFAKIHALQAFEGGRLVGFWALGERRRLLLPAVLAAPPYDYAFVGSPVIDPARADAVIPELFDAIAQERSLPKVIKLALLDGDAASYRPMMAALAARNGQVLELAGHPRPFLESASDRKRSGSTAKKLRQDWNRLGALGSVDVVNERTNEARKTFEIFLEMERQSWKGANGTALLSDQHDADFARALIGNLGDRNCASVALLRVDGRPIAAQVLLYCGTMAYTWKTAFDAAFAKFSPGALLVDKVTDAVFASGIEKFESCATEDSFMAQLWTGRRMTVDLLVDVGAQRSPAFALATLSERAYAFAREQRDRLRASNWLPGKRKSLAVTRG